MTQIIVRKWCFVKFSGLEDVAGPLKPKETRHFQKRIVKHFSAIQTALENDFPSILISGVAWVTSPHGARSERGVYNVASFISV
jgi:hypothetical protein